MRVALNRAVSGTTFINGGWINTDTITAREIYVSHLSALTANLGVVQAGVIFNKTPGRTTTWSNYTMAISLDQGFIHIR